jgi:hypothetical protein
MRAEQNDTDNKVLVEWRFEPEAALQRILRDIHDGEVHKLMK